MSNRLRAMMRLRQEAELAAAMAQRSGNLDDVHEGIRDQLRDHLGQDRYAAVPLGEEEIMRMYEPFLRDSLARQILDRYAAAQERTLQTEMASGDNEGLMRPMISSVVQLDR